MVAAVIINILFVALVPFKKQALLKWRTTSCEGDTRQPVNECNETSLVLNETELCEDEKQPIKSMEPNEIHEELSNDSKTETLSDFTIPDQEQEITEDYSTASQEDTIEDIERTCHPVPKLTCDSVTDNANSSSAVISEKCLLNTATTETSTTIPTNEISTAPPLSPGGSPEPLVVDDPTASHDNIEINKVEKITSDHQQPSDVKTSSGTDTPQQGKRKKVQI